MKGPVPVEQAMQELVDVVKTLKPDGFEANIVKQDKDYLYVEYQSPTFGVRCLLLTLKFKMLLFFLYF